MTNNAAPIEESVSFTKRQNCSFRQICLQNGLSTVADNNRKQCLNRL
ncbi:hypothetical protein [Coleofasciculus sp.]